MSLLELVCAVDDSFCEQFESSRQTSPSTPLRQYLLLCKLASMGASHDQLKNISSNSLPKSLFVARMP